MPLAMEPGTSTAAHLARMGFEVVSSRDTARWLSREYWKHATLRYCPALRELLSR
jgi:hypothetical protein